MNRREIFFGLAIPAALVGKPVQASTEGPLDYWCISCEKHNHLIFQFSGPEEFKKLGLTYLHDGVCGICGGFFRNTFNQLHFRTGWR